MYTNLVLTFLLALKHKGNVDVFFSLQYIFKRQEYNKPFFSTFTKTSMFVLYLLGFLLWRPWRQQCTGTLKRRHSAFVSNLFITAQGHSFTLDAVDLENMLCQGDLNIAKLKDK